MEIKHTVEILTKDIQDIEKLVRNLNNSPNPPRIELDLALSKLRNVYELLSMIRTDAEQETQTGETTEIPAAAEVQEEPVVEMPVVEKPVVEAPIVEEPVVEEPEQAVQQAELFQPKKEAEILAEKFSNDPSINENIASKGKQEDLTSKLSGQPIDNIKRNIGINDRFLIIRELFDGDNDSYCQLIDQLDSSSDSEEALGILDAKFPEQANHEGYLLLSQLTRRKFISG